MEPKYVTMKGNMELDKLINYLEDLVGSLKKGVVYVEQEGDFIELNPPDAVDVAIEAGEKKGKQKFKLQLNWKKRLQDTGQGLTLKISSEKPEIPEAEPEPPAKKSVEADVGGVDGGDSDTP